MNKIEHARKIWDEYKNAIVQETIEVPLAEGLTYTISVYFAVSDDEIVIDGKGFNVEEIRAILPTLNEWFKEED